MIRRFLMAGAMLALVGCSQSDFVIPEGSPVGTRTPRPAGEAELAADEACGAVRIAEDLGADHLGDGETATYPTYPPASGTHDPRWLGPGVYPEPLTRDPSGATTPTIFRAVHSLEHGYVLVFHNGLTDEQAEAMADRYGDELKVIVAPEPSIEEKVLLLAWRRVRSCREVSADSIDAFITRYRERTAPEPGAP